MTHLKQAQDWLKAREHGWSPSYEWAHGYDVGVLAFARYLDSLEKPKDVFLSLKEQGYTIEYDPVADRHSAVPPKPTPLPEELKWQEPAVATFSMNQIEENTRCISENIATIGKLLARSLQPRNQ